MGWLAVAALGLSACGDNFEPAPNPTPPSGGGAAVVQLSATSKPTSGTVGTAVVTPVIIKVVDLSQNPVAGQRVTFSLTSGGSLQQSVDTTDAQGLASPGTWTLGSVKGTQRLVATAAGASLAIDVSTVTTAGAIDSVVAPAGLNGGQVVAGTAPSSLSFVAVDSFNNRIGAGIRVRFRALEGTLVAADSAINTSAASAVAPRWTLSTVVGPQRLELWYLVNGVQQFDTVTVEAICSKGTIAPGGTVQGQWRSEDCRTATQRRDEYNMTFAAQDARQITLTGIAGQSLQLFGGGRTIQAVPPAYLFAGGSPYALRYALPAGNYVVQANSGGLTDQVYTLSVGATLGNGTSAYLPPTGCAEVGNVPLYTTKGLDAFNWHRSTPDCNVGGLGDFQDRYLIQLKAGEKLRADLLHATAQGPGVPTTTQFNLYLRDASTAGGAVVATSATPTSPSGRWRIDYTAPSDGLYEVVVGTSATYDVDFGMDYELILGEPPVVAP